MNRRNYLFRLIIRINHCFIVRLMHLNYWHLFRFVVMSLSYLIYQSALCFLFLKSRVDISNRLVEISDEPRAVRLIKYL